MVGMVAGDVCMDTGRLAGGHIVDNVDAGRRCLWTEQMIGIYLLWRCVVAVLVVGP